jgi:hypothetical protein
VLAVVLQHQLASAVPGGGGGLEGARSAAPAVRDRLAEPVAAAFAHTYWWSLALTAVALIPALVLALVERRERRERSLAGAPPAPAQLAG